MRGVAQPPRRPPEEETGMPEWLTATLDVIPSGCVRLREEDEDLDEDDFDDDDDFDEDDDFDDEDEEEDEDE
jgi:hypothetical protein